MNRSMQFMMSMTNFWVNVYKLYAPVIIKPNVYICTQTHTPCTPECKQIDTVTIHYLS